MVQSVIPMAATTTFILLAVSLTKNALVQAAAAVFTSCTIPSTVAFTFDHGPYVYLRGIVSTLDNAGTKGTFFFTGSDYGCIYEQETAEAVNFTYANGHQIALQA
ncbi:Carbohydrate esterase 4 protein [Lunasporangiospora selenospora]|uniref:Carbohydrate esterase 4 protein n=1 Tax=Lunasporangiospora selenospora TaxID=979761 RepID=A0A9P6KCS3_9FUNG|nr:Carbohydrate esterase 4 protein [Lunasporangiospora selenospora]